MKSKGALFEAIDWGIFSIGGVIASFLLPANIIITLVLQKPIPNGLLASFPVIPLTNLYLFLVLGGAAWHAIHRIRFILFGFGLSHYRSVVTVITSIVLALILGWAFQVLLLI